MDTAVLQETRNLLNSLNEENSELKAHAEHLTQQWRHAVNELELERQRFAQLEHDSKQINSTLIKQLKALQSDGKASQSTQDMLERRAHSMELQLERLADEKASAEDRVSALERNLQEAISREERERREKLDARAESDRIAAELQRTLSAEREQTVASERSLATRCDELSLELQRQQDLVASLKKQHDVQKRENDRAVEKLRSQLELANEDASRTRHAESECTYAHEEVHAVAENYYETLSDLQARCRASEIDSAEVGNSLISITDKFRNLALAASAQRTNSEALIDFYSNNYAEVKQLLEATVAENYEIRNSVDERVAAAVAEIERLSRDAAIRQEKAHQDQLSSTISNLESKQRERDAFAKENDRLKDALRESHDTEKQLRAFSEQLYADVVGAQKVASEAAEKERNAKVELATLERRVTEQVRRDVVVAFEQERSKMVAEFNRSKRDYEMEITELRSKLEENAMTLTNALNKITPSLVNNHSAASRHRSASSSNAVSISNNAKHQYFTHNRFANQNHEEYENEDEMNEKYDNESRTHQRQSSSNIVSPETPMTTKRQQQQQQQQQQHRAGRGVTSASSSLNRERYSVEPGFASSNNNDNNNAIPQQQKQQRSASAPILSQPLQFHDFQDDSDVDYSAHHQASQNTVHTMTHSQHDESSPSPQFSNANHRVNPTFVTSSHSPLRNAAALPRPVQNRANTFEERDGAPSKGFCWDSKSNNAATRAGGTEYDDRLKENDEEQNSSCSPSQLRWPPSTRNAAIMRQKQNKK